MPPFSPAPVVVCSFHSPLLMGKEGGRTNHCTPEMERKTVRIMTILFKKCDLKFIKQSVKDPEYQIKRNYTELSYFYFLTLGIFKYPFLKSFQKISRKLKHKLHTGCT